MPLNEKSTARVLLVSRKEPVRLSAEVEPLSATPFCSEKGACPTFGGS